MRIKGVFTLFARKLPSGQKVFYYQCYDQKGRRQWAKSTGQSRKTEAVAFCMKLYKDGLLIPEKKLPTFAEFSAGWWEADTCRYLKWRELHEPLTKSTINIHKLNFHNTIKDYYAKYRLDEITPEVIEEWLLYLSRERELMASTINLHLRTFRMMMGEAFRIKLIAKNPCKEVKEVRQEDTKRVILSVDEAKKLFPPDWTEIWETQIVYTAHLLAACTGLRIGELRGLRRDNVFDDYLSINGQYSAFGYSPHTKTKHNRNVPITTLMREQMQFLLEANGDGYVFSDNGGETPVGIEKINRQYDRALEKIGISHEEKLERKLSFHSWRHFLNTLLRMSNVADSKVQSVTGHRSMRMTEHYTHFDTRQFTEVRDVQTNLLTFNKQAKSLPAKAKTQKAEKTDKAVKAKATKKTVKQTTAAIKKNPAKKP